ncbi:MAG: peptidoglycan-binding protein [Leptothrix sp. (in: Bacteria)]|nr:peptidoglycan-binding protein [Leptothrix sp. (in: b-proteobacteria)]
MTPGAAAKARLIELDETFKELSGGKQVTVQFNPESLKLSFANQVQTPPTSGTAAGGGSGGGTGDQGAGTAGQQFVGSGTTKLSVQLWFDANAAADSGERVDDVRRLTQEVVYFITGKKSQRDPTRFIPPGVRFAWGSFLFEGLIESIEETIDFFSPDGHPLRASMQLGLTQQNILVASFGDAARPPGVPAGPGLSPLAAAAAGSTLQGMAAGVGAGVAAGLGAAAGGGASWQSIAAANGIDNPRALVPGQLIDLNARAPRSLF